MVSFKGSDAGDSKWMPKKDIITGVNQELKAALDQFERKSIPKNLFEVNFPF